MPFVTAIQRLTMDNQLRERALSLLTTPPDDLDERQAGLLVSERMAMLRLSRDLGVPSFHRWLAAMSSREYTEYRAMTLVETASRIIEAEQRRG